MKIFDSLIILNSMATDYLMIFLHGINSNGKDMSNRFIKFSESHKNVMIIIPTAFPLKVGLYDNKSVNSWFNIRNRSIFAKEDTQGLDESMDKILKLIEYYKFDSEKVILCGYSQGATMSLYIALNCNYKFRVIIAMSGYLPRVKHRNTHRQNILLTHGKKDTVVPFIAGWMSYMALKCLKVNVKFIKFDGEHEFPPDFEKILARYVE
ncbi:phospholipase/carboxylesterase [Hamiltosporidium tvaerminnensis]|uniref:Acyl-protein thioesterase 1 n=2 Tax=Hamiltosporidium TaxID=1176354 RepID=A0A4Q9LN84_9MICR|nr:hypothetical protein LUQ84_000892 [Hamiltosporidium tvaerminnensis]TBT99143.1 phospholipase/carboxylesterase [Hamiltosporidium tvaerminnensis]TBU08720.1 phospholipase/carboxylesterase [Hamiltosporidium magnivora]